MTKFGVGIAQPNPIPSSPRPTMTDSLLVASALPARSVAANVKVVTPGAAIAVGAERELIVVEVIGFDPVATYVTRATPDPPALSTAFNLMSKPAVSKH